MCRLVGVSVSRDEEAVTVYRRLAEVGIRIGPDVLIVSCDNEQRYEMRKARKR